MSKNNMYRPKNKKNKNYAGTISINELIINRKGKINPGKNPELRTKVHKSKKDYDRNKEKKKTRNLLENLGF